MLMERCTLSYYLRQLSSFLWVRQLQGRIQDFKSGGAHLKKLCPAEGVAKNFGVFRVKNHDFTPKNHMFFNCRGRREKFWGISCEKSRFYTKKSCFSIAEGGTKIFEVFRVQNLNPPLSYSTTINIMRGDNFLYTIHEFMDMWTIWYLIEDRNQGYHVTRFTVNFVPSNSNDTVDTWPSMGWSQSIVHGSTYSDVISEITDHISRNRN